MTAPNTESTDVEPTLAEAFSEFSAGLVESEDGPSPGDPALAAPAPVRDATQQPQGEAKAEAPQPQVEANTLQPQQGEAQAEVPIPERQPLSYTVDGQARAFEGGYIIPGHGAIITNDALPKLQDRLQQADRLVGQNQMLYTTTQEYQRFGGRAGIEKLNAEKAMLDASGALLLRALSDDATLVTLATDPVARQQLMKELQLTAREALANATTQFRENFSRQAEAGQSAQRTQTAIHNAVAYLAQEYGGLTEDDINAVRSHAARMHTAIVRPATPAEAREANVQVGAPVIDLPILSALLEDRHKLKQQVIEHAQRRQTDTLENAARAAAAAPTTVPNGRPAPRSGKAPAPTPKKGIDAMSSAELTRAMKSGRIFDMIGADDEQ